MSLSLSILAIVLGSSLCEALVPDFPRATAIQDPLFQGVGWSPRPTTAPRVPRGLFEKRDISFSPLAGSASFVLVAPDQTCGYVSGLAGAQFQCGSSTNCVFFPVTGSGFGAVGCCTDPVNCGFKTACVDSSAFSGSGCNDACQIDGNTMKCTDSSAPYCGSIRYAYPSASVEQYFCGTETGSEWQTAYTTYSGQSSAARSFKSLDRAALLSSVSSIASVSSKSAATSSKSSSSSSTSSSSTTSGTVAPTQTSAAADKKSSNNTGAIVGGVIGGCAVLGLIGAGAFFFYKRKYKNNNNSAAAPPPHTPLTELDPSKQGGAYGVYAPQPGAYSPQPQQQAYHPGYQQYQPVPVEMPVEYAQQQPHEVHEVHEKPANTPTATSMLTPDQSYMSPASAYNSPHNNNRPISEIGDTSPNATYRST